MPFIEAGDRSYLCSSTIRIKNYSRLFTSISSSDLITVRDLRKMYRRHHDMTIQGDELEELSVNGGDREMVHIKGIVFFRI